MYSRALKSVANRRLFQKRTLITPALANVEEPENWHFISAICLERKPIIAPKLSDMEKLFRARLGELEFENSFLSDYEIRHENDLKTLAKLKKGEVVDVDLNLKETAQDFLDSCIEELQKFKPATKTTEADEKNDTKSLKRKLDKHLVLVVKQRVGSEEKYLLPQARKRDEESLKEACDRILKEFCGDDVLARFCYPGPSSYYWYKYPKEIRETEGVMGAKVFIHFARYLGGSLPNKGLDYKWLDRQELQKTLPEKYRDSVMDMLIDD